MTLKDEVSPEKILSKVKQYIVKFLWRFQHLQLVYIVHLPKQDFLRMSILSHI